jgi:hypothetical protein
MDVFSQGRTYLTAFMCVNEKSENLKYIFTVNLENIFTLVDLRVV